MREEKEKACRKKFPHPTFFERAKRVGGRSRDVETSFFFPDSFWFFFWGALPLVFPSPGRERATHIRSLSMTIPEPPPGAGDSSLAPPPGSLSVGGEGEVAASAEPRAQSRGARVEEGGGGGGGGGDARKKKRRGTSDDVVDPAKEERLRTNTRRAAPPRQQQQQQHQHQHWAVSLAASAGGPLPVVLLGLGVAVSTVTVARAVAASQGKRKHSNKEGSIDGLGSGKERPDPVWRDEQGASSLSSAPSPPLRRTLSRTLSSSSSSSPRSSPSSRSPSPLSSFALPALPENAQTLLDVSLRGTSVRQLWRLAMSSDGQLQRRFMECRGNRGLEVESGSGWRVREEEEAAEGGEEGEQGGDDGNGRKRRRRKRVEIRTRVLSYVTPIGGGGGGGGGAGGGGGGGAGGGSRRASRSDKGDGGDKKAPPSFRHHRLRKTTPCCESWLCSQRSDSGFLATAVVRTPRVPFGERFYTELTWAAAREAGGERGERGGERGGGAPSSSSTTRLRVTGRVVFERAIPIPCLKTVITRAVAEGLKESYGEYRRLLLEEVEGEVVIVGENKKKEKLEKQGSVSSKPLLLFFLLLLAALFLFFYTPLLLWRSSSILEREEAKKN